MLFPSFTTQVPVLADFRGLLTGLATRLRLGRHAFRLLWLGFHDLCRDMRFRIFDDTVARVGMVQIPQVIRDGFPSPPYLHIANHSGCLLWSSTPS